MAISSKVAKKIKAGIGPRIRSKDEAGYVYGVPLEVPPSKPKAAIGPKYKRPTKSYR